MGTNAIVGEKVGMTQVWTDDGHVVPVTVVRVQPARIVQVKTPEADGYSAVPAPHGTRGAGKLNRLTAGHFARVCVNVEGCGSSVNYPRRAPSLDQLNEAVSAFLAAHADEPAPVVVVSAAFGAIVEGHDEEVRAIEGRLLAMPPMPPQAALQPTSNGAIRNVLSALLGATASATPTRMICRTALARAIPHRQRDARRFDSLVRKKAKETSSLPAASCDTTTELNAKKVIHSIERPPSSVVVGVGVGGSGGPTVGLVRGASRRHAGHQMQIVVLDTIPSVTKPGPLQPWNTESSLVQNGRSPSASERKCDATSGLTRSSAVSQVLRMQRRHDAAYLTPLSDRRKGSIFSPRGPEVLAHRMRCGGDVLDKPRYGGSPVYLPPINHQHEGEPSAYELSR